MIITNTVKRNTGDTITNAYFYVNYDTSTALVDGKIKGKIVPYVSEQERDDGKAPIVIVDDKGFPINKINFQVLPNTLVKEGPDCTFADVAIFFNSKAAEYLESTYGWTITQ